MFSNGSTVLCKSFCGPYSWPYVCSGGYIKLHSLSMSHCIFKSMCNALGNFLTLKQQFQNPLYGKVSYYRMHGVPVSATPPPSLLVSALCNFSKRGTITAVQTCLLQHMHTLLCVMSSVCSQQLHWIWQVVADLGFVCTTAGIFKCLNVKCFLNVLNVALYFDTSCFFTHSVQCNVLQQSTFTYHGCRYRCC